ncbi:ABC transporter substrate-binding protein [Propionibacteriaceae bacterium G1746]
MRRRTFLSVGAAAAATTTLAACGGNEPSTDGPVKLTFSCYAFQDATVKAVEETVKQWNASNQDIQVEYQKVDPESVHDKLVTQFAGNAAPDIIHNEVGDLAGFSKQGYLADLGALIPADLKSEVPAGLWDACTFGGKITAVPTIAQMYVVFANTKLLEKAGLKVGDWTWDDLSKNAKTLTSGATTGFAWGLKSATAGVLSTSMAYDGKWFEGDELAPTMKIGNQELAVPRHLHSMLEQKSLPTAAATMSGSDVIPGFLGGKYAMFMGGNYLASDLASKAAADFEWTMLPPLKGDSTHQVANPQTLSIARQSKHPEQAMKFIAYFMRAQNLGKFGHGDALVPVTKAATEEARKLHGGKYGWDAILDSFDSLVGAPMTRAEKYSQWKSEVGNPVFQEYFATRIDEATMVKRLTDGWQKINT